MLSSFHALIGHSCVSSGEMAVRVICPLLNEISFLVLNCSSLYILYVIPLSDIRFAIFSRVPRAAFTQLTVSLDALHSPLHVDSPSLCPHTRGKDLLVLPASLTTTSVRRRLPSGVALPSPRNPGEAAQCRAPDPQHVGTRQGGPVGTLLTPWPKP